MFTGTYIEQCKRIIAAIPKFAESVMTACQQTDSAIDIDDRHRERVMRALWHHQLPVFWAHHSTSGKPNLLVPYTTTLWTMAGLFNMQAQPLFSQSYRVFFTQGLDDMFTPLNRRKSNVNN